MDTLTGSVERVTYYNPENGYSVVRLRPDKRNIPNADRSGLVTIVGNLPEISSGEHLRLRGDWTKHPKHGLQFNVDVCEQSLPATITGIRRYLGSGLIKGIGPRLAERIVDHFGVQTLEIIEEHPERLLEVPDIGPKRTGIIAAAWIEQRQVKEIMLFLHGHGVSTNLAIKIYKTYGDQALGVVRNDPYRLARDIYGVGFKTADRIAQDLGLPPEHPSRIEAGVIYTLDELNANGHVYAPIEFLTEQVIRILEVPADLISPALQRLANDDLIRVEELPIKQTGIDIPGETKQQAIYLTPFYVSERGTAELLRDLALTLPSRLSDLPPSFIAIDESLSSEQQNAIRTALTNPVSVITGGPGTGKTTTIRALIAAVETGRKRYALASPTGRAAKRIAEATGRPASTIHRLLGYSPIDGFKHHTGNPLAIDLLVVDEVSMLDTLLAYHLLKALKSGTHLVLVGDVDQLPSVGAGDVLRDVIASGIAPVTRLTLIFRQAADSFIISNAHRVNQGQMPVFPNSADVPGGAIADFFLFPAETPETTADWVEEVVCSRIPRKFGLDPVGEIQVMAPMYRGSAGVNALNDKLQASLNPAGANKPEKQLLGRTFRRGDKVMQIKNNYDKNVFNGDIGFITGISLLEHNLTVDFDDRGVIYEWSESDEIVLAYAVSVHKAQGSEFPAVVLPLITQHYLMLQRNLLYTAITRAQKLCVLVGSRRAIGIAVKNDKVAHRYAALDLRLRRGQ
jgi:exodeoxyribonuclease V alpha subunit